MVMNNRPIEKKLLEGVLDQILTKFDKAGSGDVFNLCLSLGKGARKLPQDSVSTDIYYAIFLKSMQVLSECDLYQISQIGNFMSSPGASRNVPDEFWTGCIEEALQESLLEFKKYSDVINRESYLEDFMSCLVSFGIRGIASEKLQKTVIDLVRENQEHMTNKSQENFMFFLDRCHQPRGEDFEVVNTLMDNITKDELILQGEIRDHLLILSLIQKYGLDQNLLIQQIEYVFHEQFLTEDSDAQKSLSKP